MTESDSGTNIVEMMPDNVSEAITKAIAEGRLCRYAVDLESQLTAERKKVQQLREAIEDYIHNDIGRKDTLHNLEKAFFDTDDK